MPPAAVHAEAPEEESAEPDDYDAFAHEPPFSPRRSRAKMWTLAAVAAAVLMLAAVAAISYWGLPTIGGGAAQSAEAPLVIEYTRDPERTTMESGNELLTVYGRVVNTSQETQRVPQIRAELRDAGGRIVYVWSISAPVSELRPKESATFNSAEVDVPKGARALNLSFGSPS